MPTKLAAIEAQAMKLDSKSRARLAQRLIRSLDDTSEAEIERLWYDEAERRALEIQEGRVKARPAAAVLRRVRREISGKRSRSTP
jgi:hypothetical protein